MCLPPCLPSLCPHISILFPFASGLISPLFPFIALLVVHCVRLVSFCFFLSLVLSPLLLVTVAVWFSFSFHLSPFLFVLVSALSSFLSPFVSGLVFLLVGHCVHLVSLLFPFFSLGHCVRLVFLLFPFVSLLSFTLASFFPLSLAFVSQRWAVVLQSSTLQLHLSPSCDCCVCLCLAILYYMCPRKPLHFVSQLCSCLPVSTFVSSSGLLWPPLSCNPLFLRSGCRKL